VTWERLFGWRHAFDHPVTRWIALGAAGALAIAFFVVVLLSATRAVSGSLRGELCRRTLSWVVMAPLIVGPVLLGAAWHMAATFLLSLACYGEFARATGLFREKLTSLVVVLGIVSIWFAVADHWYGLFVALFPLGVAVIAASTIVLDRPKGYLQRVGLGVFGFTLFGCALGHLAYFGNDWNYRPIVLTLLAGVQSNDVFAFVVGKTLGRRKLVPLTSPGKTIAGSMGAILLATPLVAILAHFTFLGSELDRPARLLLLGLLTSVSGQLGDLMLSSIKRDVGVKDMGAVIPGHGGVLDRFNSALIAAPVFFHFVGYFLGVGLDQPPRIFTGD
jgi:phosphatidate cytidylyltransferase